MELTRACDIEGGRENVLPPAGDDVPAEAKIDKDAGADNVGVGPKIDGEEGGRTGVEAGAEEGAGATEKVDWAGAENMDEGLVATPKEEELGVPKTAWVGMVPKGDDFVGAAVTTGGEGVGATPKVDD